MYSKSFSSTLAPLGNGTHGTLTLKACTISSGVFPARRSQRQGGANGKEEPTSGLAPWHQELPARRSQQVPKKTSNLQLHSEGASLCRLLEKLLQQVWLRQCLRSQRLQRLLCWGMSLRRQRLLSRGLSLRGQRLLFRAVASARTAALWLLSCIQFDVATINIYINNLCMYMWCIMITTDVLRPPIHVHLAHRAINGRVA